MTPNNQKPTPPANAANALFVPTLEQWAAMSWHQRAEFCRARFVTRTRLIECERQHYPDPDREPLIEGVFTRQSLERLRTALLEEKIRRNPHPDADQHWNDLALAIGAHRDLRPIKEKTP